MIRRPHHQANVHSDVVTPLLQSAVTAILFAVVLGYCCYEFDWPFQVIIPAFAITLLGMWMLLLWSHRRHMWEYIQQTEVEQQAPAAPTVQPVSDWRVEITQRGPERNRATMSRLTVPAGISPDTFTTMAWETLRGTPFTERQWHGRGIEVSDFRALRHELLKAGMLSWRVEGAPTQGVNLTDAGRNFLRQVAQEGKLDAVEFHSPTPSSREGA